MPDQKRSITFYSLHLPILFAILALTLVVSYALRPQDDTESYSYAIVQRSGEVMGTNTAILTEGGKTAEVTKEIVGEKVIIRMKVYDSSGNLIREKVTENQLKTPVKTQEKIDSPDKVRTPEPTKTHPPVDDVPLIKEDKERGNTQFKVREATSTPNSATSPAFSRFPINLSEDTGLFYIQTPTRTVELSLLPDEIGEKARLSGEMTSVSSVAIEANENSEPIYRVQGVREKALLRLIPVKINIEQLYDIESGEVLTTRISSGRDKLLNYLSF